MLKDLLVKWISQDSNKSYVVIYIYLHSFAKMQSLENSLFFLFLKFLA